MCLSAISFVGIKRVVYAALAEDANVEELIARGLTAQTLNPLLTRGPLELVPGVLCAEGARVAGAHGETLAVASQRLSIDTLLVVSSRS